MFLTVPVRAPRTPLTPTQKAERATRRRKVWVLTAVALSLLAVVVEGKFHLCASNLFDPLPDLINGVACAWVVFFLWFNQAVLSTPSPGETMPPRQNPLLRYLGPKRATGIALAGTSVALLVAGMAVWMFAPLLLAVPMLPVVFFMGLRDLVGALAKGTAIPPTSDIIPMLSSPLLLVPFIDFLVLLFQFRALRRLGEAAANGVSGKVWKQRVSFGTRLLLSAAVFFLIVRPALIGFTASRILHEEGAAQRQRFAALRVLGGQETLLDLTYRRNPPYWVCFGYQVMENGPLPWTGYSWSGMDAESTQAARRAFFLMTGTPFESVPRPASAARQNATGQPDDVAIEETGGLLVGRPVPCLSLAASDLVFSTDAQTETGEGSWTMTFRNATDAPQEARADVLLPPGATCHAVSLWINGVEKPAAFGSPQKVRAAYQEIAVVQRRDPLLVTMPAPDHLLVQCFPVPAHGEMKIKLGITAPLTWRYDTLLSEHDPFNAPRLYLTFPAFGAVNFDIAEPKRSKFSMSPHTFAMKGSERTNGTFGLSTDELFTPRHYPIGPRSNAYKVGHVLAPGVVRTADPVAFPQQPIDVWLLLDASQGMNDLLTDRIKTAIEYTLRDLPTGSRVFFGDTTNIPDLPELPRYTGGTDPAPAIEHTLREAREKGWDARHASVVVFLHAASPAHVSDLSAVRKELHQRNVNIHGSVSGPALVCIQLAPHAPDAIAMDLAGFSNVYARRALPGDAFLSTAEALRFAAQAAVSWDDKTINSEGVDVSPLPMGGRVPGVNGVSFLRIPTNDAGPHAVPRLRQASLTIAQWLRSNEAAKPGEALDLRIAAGAPAAIARLVTPVSSAVVLETQTQYEAHGLDAKNGKKGYANAKNAPDPNQPNVNVPEPATGVLLLVGLLMGRCAAFALPKGRKG